MKILNICKFDYAGYAWDLTRALKRHTHHKVRHVAMSKHEWRFGSDIVTTKPKELREWIEWADVVNCLESFRPFGTANLSGHNNLIVTYVGDGYPRQYKEYRSLWSKYGVKRALHAGILYSGLADGWVPYPVPVDEYGFFRASRNVKPVICQTPSNRRRKCTEEIIALLESKKDVELLIVDGVKHRQCLEAKAKADIFIGHFPGKQINDYISLGGCGKASLEAWAMKIPVIACAAEPRRSAYLKTVGYLPYYESELNDLPGAIDALLDEQIYKEYSEKGWQYVKTFHDDPVVAQRFLNVCQEIMAG